jgi:hypothetical protein
MPSTVIKRFVYVPERRELVVEFVTGRRYAYADVPEEAVAQFQPPSPRAITSIATSATGMRAASWHASIPTRVS